MVAATLASCSIFSFNTAQPIFGRRRIRFVCCSLIEPRYQFQKARCSFDNGLFCFGQTLGPRPSSCCEPFDLAIYANQTLRIHNLNGINGNHNPCSISRNQSQIPSSVMIFEHGSHGAWLLRWFCLIIAEFIQSILHCSRKFIAFNRRELVRNRFRTGARTCLIGCQRRPIVVSQQHAGKEGHTQA